jgi:SAM-dependent methyltransferase
VCCHAPPAGRHLDLGCGIGIVCEALAKRHPNTEVVGCDLSPQNIWYCRQTVRLPNSRFFEGNLLDRDVFTRELAGRRFDSISLVDVLEHIPLTEHEQLFRDMMAVGTEDLRIVLTFPSIGYQDQLRTHEPEGLQPVDESISLAHLSNLSDRLGLHIMDYRLRDVWLSNQYVHCVIRRSAPVEPLHQPQRGILSRWAHRLKRSYFARVQVPWRKRKYITQVFGKK